MDVCKPEQRLHKLAAADPTRPPLVSAEKNNGPLNTRHSRTREVSSRHKSPTPSTPSGPRRCPSPTPSRTTPTPSPGVQKRAVSAERKRPATPPPLQITSTPVNDSSTAAPISSRRLSTGRIPDSLWPSTMRNLSVPFQSGTLSPVSKKEKEKPVSNVSLDRTLRPSSNVAHIKQSETSTLSRKPSPERKRSHLEGENAPDQSENAKPVDGLPSRLIDHHRWPSRIGGKLSSNSPNKSVDQGCKIVKNLSTPNLELSSLKRMPVSDSSAKPLLKSSNDAGRLLSIDDIGRVGFAATSIDDKPRRASFPASILSPSSLDKTPLTTSGSQSQSPRKTSVSRGVSPHLPRPSTPTARGASHTSRGVSPTPRGVSPTRMRTSTSSSQSHSSTPVLSPTPRVVSPTRMRTSTSSSQSHSSTPRVVSPTRMRTSTLSSQSHSSTSVLSFVTDCKKGRKGVNSMEDAHQLRLLYNRYLQWRFANAHAEAVFDIQKVNSEETLYNVWNDTLDLCNALIKEKINLQWLKLELKLDSLLNHQMAYLDNWALLERDHISSLAGAEEDLEASTLLIPITGGAKADIESLKAAICSAVDVMQAMGSSICSLLPKVEGVNYRVSELAAIGAQEKNMLDQCEALLSSTAAMQLEECSLMAHLTQTKQPLKKSKQPTTAAKAFPWP
ncbi:AUGMIN subunit 8-like isoform X3 [Hibiscus syriacus]|uniref:AUGMIN subunit 8-like isoform X3 n=1 Tax=Hibiscus syriacus TaxID=106335 RepID=UPI0019222362|nr:AUGMIN subunit 8-like isoform X3 [Hibiscus syriacus]